MRSIGAVVGESGASKIAFIVVIPYAIGKAIGVFLLHWPTQLATEIAVRMAWVALRRAEGRMPSRFNSGDSGRTHFWGPQAR